MPLKVTTPRTARREVEVRRAARRQHNQSGAEGRVRDDDDDVERGCIDYWLCCCCKNWRDLFVGNTAVYGVVAIVVLIADFVVFGITQTDNACDSDAPDCACEGASFWAYCFLFSGLTLLFLVGSVIISLWSGCRLDGSNRFNNCCFRSLSLLCFFAGGLMEAVGAIALITSACTGDGDSSLMKTFSIVMIALAAVLVLVGMVWLSNYQKRIAAKKREANAKNNPRLRV